MNTKGKNKFVRTGAGKDRWYCIGKRCFDLVAALLGSVVLMPLLLLIALLVKLDSPGPILYRQERLGKNGMPFALYKFRSMMVDAEPNGPCWAERNDVRCTRFGRFLRRTHLDELPQLWNILRGEMSFVGPRPERAYFYDLLEADIPEFRLRLRVLPGLTGLAQISGGFAWEPEKKLYWDLRYINERSVGVDLSCLVRTVLLGARKLMEKGERLWRPIPF